MHSPHCKFFTLLLASLSTLHQNKAQNVYCDQANTIGSDLQAVTEVIKAEQQALKDTVKLLRSSCVDRDVLDYSLRELTDNITLELDTATAMIEENTVKRNAEIVDLQKSIGEMFGKRAKSFDAFKERLLDQLAAISASLDFSARVLYDIKSDDVQVRDCWDIYRTGRNKSGIYRIWPKGWKNIGSFYVYCEMEHDGGGWTVLYKESSTAEPMFFSRSWMDYNLGFGELSDNFWIGNDKICCLSNQKEYIAHFDLWNKKNENIYAEYKLFLVFQRNQQYKLQIGAYNGTAGDILSTSNNVGFSTRDQNNANSSENCAAHFNIGWWYTGCASSDKSRFALPEGFGDISRLEMKIRPLL